MSEESANAADLFEIMRTTRSMRRLKPDPVPNELIRKFLEAGVCRRKIEMSPGVQSRDDTRVPDGHEEELLGLHLGRGVEQRI